MDALSGDGPAAAYGGGQVTARRLPSPWAEALERRRPRVRRRGGRARGRPVVERMSARAGSASASGFTRAREPPRSSGVRAAPVTEPEASEDREGGPCPGNRDRVNGRASRSTLLASFSQRGQAGRLAPVPQGWPGPLERAGAGWARSTSSSARDARSQGGPRPGSRRLRSARSRSERGVEDRRCRTRRSREGNYFRAPPPAPARTRSFQGDRPTRRSTPSHRRRPPASRASTPVTDIQRATAGAAGKRHKQRCRRLPGFDADHGVADS